MQSGWPRPGTAEPCLESGGSRGPFGSGGPGRPRPPLQAQPTTASPVQASENKVEAGKTCSLFTRACFRAGQFCAVCAVSGRAAPASAHSALLWCARPCGRPSCPASARCPCLPAGEEAPTGPVQQALESAAQRALKVEASRRCPGLRRWRLRGQIGRDDGRWSQVLWQEGGFTGPMEPAFSLPHLAWPLGGGLLCLKQRWPSPPWRGLESSSRSDEDLEHHSGWSHPDPANLPWKQCVQSPRKSQCAVSAARRRLVSGSVATLWPEPALLHHFRPFPGPCLPLWSLPPGLCSHPAPCLDGLAHFRPLRVGFQGRQQISPLQLWVLGRL